MALSDNQKRVPKITGRIITSEPLELSPADRLRNIRQHRGFLYNYRPNKTAITHNDPDGFGGSQRRRAQYDIYNIDGEIYLRPDTIYHPPGFGKRKTTDDDWKRNERSSVDLLMKVQDLAQGMQRICDEAGRGEEPNPYEITVVQTEVNFSHITAIIYDLQRVVEGLKNLDKRFDSTTIYKSYTNTTEKTLEDLYKDHKRMYTFLTKAKKEGHNVFLQSRRHVNNPLIKES